MKSLVGIGAKSNAGRKRTATAAARRVRPPPRPEGAMECSHGWSPGWPGRNPWCIDSGSRPGGAEELRLA